MDCSWTWLVGRTDPRCNSHAVRLLVQVVVALVAAAVALVSGAAAAATFEAFDVHPICLRHYDLCMHVSRSRATAVTDMLRCCCAVCCQVVEAQAALVAVAAALVSIDCRKPLPPAFFHLILCSPTPACLNISGPESADSHPCMVPVMVLRTCLVVCLCLQVVVAPPAALAAAVAAPVSDSCRLPEPCMCGPLVIWLYGSSGATCTASCTRCPWCQLLLLPLTCCCCAVLVCPGGGGSSGFGGSGGSFGELRS
jgi:hypothetical protein